VRFEAVHRFHGPVKAVASTMTDPSFYSGLELPDLSLPEVLEHSDGEGEGRSVLRLRYEFTGSLEPWARRLLGGDRLGWVQETNVQASARSGSLRFEAEKDPRRLHGQADFVLDVDGDETVRRLEGELVVKVRAIGGMAERRIVPGLLRRMEIEARALDGRLRRRQA
jgi:Protein of unknown function (DUF2505)